MVSDIGFSDALTLVQTIGIVGIMVLTLYFSKRQIQSLSRDTETRVLNEMDEKIGRVLELVLERPSLSKVMHSLDPDASSSGDYLFSYYILSVCSQAFVMRQRNVLKESEWRPYVHLMVNCFQRGTISEISTRIQKDRWVDPAFQNFINSEIARAKAR